MNLSYGGPPRSYSVGRSRPVQYVVVHYTAGSEGPTSAEDGAAYDRRRTDGTSCHIFVDSDSAVRMVYDRDIAHHARYHGNEIGLGLEICGTRQTRAQWLDAVSLTTLRNAASVTAVWCALHNLPVRRLTDAETRAAYYGPEKPRGIVGHDNVTRAYPEDEGTHLDPGADFPWDFFLGLVQEEMASRRSQGGNPLMLIDSQATDFAALIWRVQAVISNNPVVLGGPLEGEVNNLKRTLDLIIQRVESVHVRLASLESYLKEHTTQLGLTFDDVKRAALEAAQEAERT